MQQSRQNSAATKVVVKSATGRVSSEMYAQSPMEVDTVQDRVGARVIKNYLEGHPQSPYRVGYIQDVRIATIAGHQSSHTVADIEALQATLDISPLPSVTTAQSLVYTDVTTDIDGTTKIIPGYLIPDSYTIPAGKEVTINGRPTILQTPDLLLTYVSVTRDGRLVYTLAYIVQGHSTASVGQTMTLAGRPTVLNLPSAVFAQVATTIDGKATSTPISLSTAHPQPPLDKKSR
jgi:hypothetical protein